MNPSTESVLEPRVVRNLQILFVVGVLYWASLASQLPVLPLYISHVGASETWVGIVMGCLAVGLVVFRAQVAYLADHQGRKRMLLLGLLTVAIAPVGYWLAPMLASEWLGVGIGMGVLGYGMVRFRLPLWVNEQIRTLGKQLAILTVAIALLGFFLSANLSAIPALMLFRIIHGLSLAAFTTAYIALVVDLSPPQKRGELVGTMLLVNPLAVTMGPAIAGWMQVNWGYSSVFLADAFLGAIGMWGIAWIWEPPTPGSTSAPLDPPLSGKVIEQRSEEPDKSSYQSFWSRLERPEIRLPTLVLFLLGITFGAVTTFVPLYIRAMENPFNPGLFYTATAITSFSSRFLVGRASDRFGRGVFITLSLIVYTFSLLVLTQADSQTTILIAGLCEGAGFGALMPLLTALVADRSQPDERASIFGLCMLGFDFGLSISGPLLGVVVEQWGFQSLFRCALFLGVSSIVAFMTAASKTLPHSLRFALGQEGDVYAVH